MFIFYIGYSSILSNKISSSDEKQVSFILIDFLYLTQFYILFIPVADCKNLLFSFEQRIYQENFLKIYISS